MDPRWLWLAAVLVSAAGHEGGIERLKNCGRRDLCRDRPPELLTSPALMTDKLRKSVQCFCDDECPEYGDCCLDAASELDAAVDFAKECVPLSYNQSVFAVTKCAEGGSEGLEKLCTKAVSSESYHYTLDVPVYSNRTEQHYANIYCASCNGENTSSIQRLSFHIQCDNASLTLQQLVKHGKYQKGELQWVLGNATCHLVVQNQLSKGRACVPSISSCPVDSDLLTSKKCKMYSLPVSLEGTKIFKNSHCALCNEVTQSSLTCWHDFDFRGYPSLSIIFDFDWDFDTCDLPVSVWDGLRRHCTMSDGMLVICDNDTTCIQPSKHHHMGLSLRIEGYITIVCMSISIFCLFLHLSISVFLPHSKHLPGKILNSLSISLFIAQILFLTGIEPIIPIPYDVCQAVAVLIHFFFLSSFFWMNVMSIDIWRTFSNSFFKSQPKRSHAKYSLYAWGGAGFVSIIAILSDQTDVVPEDYRPFYAAVPDVCWFANRTGLAIFFFFPICILLFFNIVLFSITVCWFQKQHRESDFMNSSGRKEYIRLWLYIKLFIIMGLTWCCGMISSFADKPNYNYPFIILNGLQGTFLFIMFDLKTEILQIVLKKSDIFSNRGTNSKLKRLTTDITNTTKLNSSK